MAAEPLGARVRRLGARASGNSRTVLLTYPGLRLGNILYFALHAHLQRAAGVDYRVVDPAPADEWGRAIPGLGPLLLHPNQVRWTDKRVHIPPSFLQDFGQDFTAIQLEDFVRERLLETFGSGKLGTADYGDEDEVVINVRRGDYYSVPTFRQLFSYDILDYTMRALALLEDQSGPARSVLVVSDDPRWCMNNMTFLHARSRRVRWSAPTDGALENMRSLTRARRLILANSTFSYWGAYVSNVFHGDNYHEVCAPKLHSRDVRAGLPWQHHPNWHSLDVIEV